eukprot:1698883-Prymnesium_polylepis.2
MAPHSSHAPKPSRRPLDDSTVGECCWARAPFNVPVSTGGGAPVAPSSSMGTGGGSPLMSS